MNKTFAVLVLGLCVLALNGFVRTAIEYQSPSYKKYCVRKCWDDKGVDFQTVSILGKCKCETKERR